MADNRRRLGEDRKNHLADLSTHQNQRPPITSAPYYPQPRTLSSTSSHTRVPAGMHVPYYYNQHWQQPWATSHQLSESSAPLSAAYRRPQQPHPSMVPVTRSAPPQRQIPQSSVRTQRTYVAPEASMSSSDPASETKKYYATNDRKIPIGDSIPDYLECRSTGCNRYAKRDGFCLYHFTTQGATDVAPCSIESVSITHSPSSISSRSYHKHAARVAKPAAQLPTTAAFIPAVQATPAAPLSPEGGVSASHHSSSSSSGYSPRSHSAVSQSSFVSESSSASELDSDIDEPKEQQSGAVKRRHPPGPKMAGKRRARKSSREQQQSASRASASSPAPAAGPESLYSSPKRTHNKKRCCVEGCQKFVQRKGFCFRHGPPVKRCSVEGCTKAAVKADLCIGHGAPVRRCAVPNCRNISVKNGICIRHGAPVKRCSKEGCTNVSVKDGVCIRHGAKVSFKKKRCSVSGCEKIAKKKGLCVRHGTDEGVNICKAGGCRTYAKKDGLCTKHFSLVRAPSALHLQNYHHPSGSPVRIAPASDAAMMMRRNSMSPHAA